MTDQDKSQGTTADPRPVLLVYADKTWEGTAFREELAALRDRLDLEVVHVLEEPHEGWEGEAGFVTPELLARHLPDEAITRHVFVCGPPAMMDAVHAALLERGVPEANIQLEKFALA